jgi:hypothetical protein
MCCTGLAFERSHTILGLREGVHTPSGGVNTGSVNTENVVFTHKKWCSHSVCHIFQQMVDVWIILSDFEAILSDFTVILSNFEVSLELFQVNLRCSHRHLAG